jgi:O-methyltransferase
MWLQSLRLGARDCQELGERVAELERDLREAEARRLEACQRAESLEGALNAYKDALLVWSGRGPPAYDADRLTVWNKSVTFMSDPRFIRAYRRGMDSGHMIGRPKGSSEDIHIEWRIAICCWAGWHAKQLEGDFVECGTNTGIMSLAVCDYTDFNSLDKSFFLFDTFRGVPDEQIDNYERAIENETRSSHYEECYERTRSNFAPFPRAQLVRGKVPDTLNSVVIDRVAYLCIDMNIAYPEKAALEHFWPKLTRGAVVILDDYGWVQCRRQKEVLDASAQQLGARIFLLPTGQGMMLKP